MLANFQRASCSVTEGHPAGLRACPDSPDARRIWPVRLRTISYPIDFYQENPKSGWALILHRQLQRGAQGVNFALKFHSAEYTTGLSLENTYQGAFPVTTYSRHNALR